MGGLVPVKFQKSELSEKLISSGLTRVHMGKVRDTFSLAGHDDKMLLVATDRLSIFDFVLPSVVPNKGEVLTALTVFWMTKVLSGENHLVAYGSGIDEYLPEALKGYADLQKRAMIVKKLEMYPIECVVRGYLTGSGWSAYKQTKEVCGHKLEDELFDGSKLPKPIFTPTTKAEVGHDEHVSFESVRDEFGMILEEMTLKVYTEIADHAASHGIILADTKFEFGKVDILGDEVGTPDSSRFWDKEEWEKASAERRSPSGYDKEPVRQWGKTVETPFDIKGIHKLDTESTEHLDFVHSLEIPENVLAETTDRYRRILKRLSEMELEDFQKEIMNIG